MLYNPYKDLSVLCGIRTMTQRKYIFLQGTSRDRAAEGHAIGAKSKDK